MLQQNTTQSKLSNRESISKAYLIIAALMHESVIPIPSAQIDEDLLDCGVKIVAAMLDKFDAPPGDHAPLPFEW